MFGDKLSTRDTVLEWQNLQWKKWQVEIETKAFSYNYESVWLRTVLLLKYIFVLHIYNFFVQIIYLLKNWTMSTMLSITTYSTMISTEKKIIKKFLVLLDCLETERNANEQIMKKIQNHNGFGLKCSDFYLPKAHLSSLNNKLYLIFFSFFYTITAVIFMQNIWFLSNIFWSLTRTRSI